MQKRGILVKTEHRLSVGIALALFVFVGNVGFGCAPKPAVEAKQLPSAVRAHQADRLDPALLNAALAGKEGDAYRVGPGDRLLVAVYGHQELSLATYAGANLRGDPGLVVDNDGTIQLPLMGSVYVSGKSAEELRVLLERELALYVKDPRVTVQVVFNGSLRYYLLGQFTAPGLKYSDRPLRLLEALALGGSVQMESASLRSAYLARGPVRLPVNLFRLLREGDLTQNIRLQSGDVVMVPDSQSEKAFVFGGAAGSNPRGGAINFNNGRLTLLQALADAGFGIRDRQQSKMSDVRVIRSEGDRGELFIVDAEMILEGEAADFELAPGDVVFVPNTAITSWNEALAQLLPSLQTISGLLSPFVQIKYLTED
jgi:polysaccharide export outer membrane protein